MFPHVHFHDVMTVCSQRARVTFDNLVALLVLVAEPVPSQVTDLKQKHVCSLCRW